MITIATPLSAINTMWSLSFLSSLIAKFCALVRLGLGRWEALSTQFISALSSSTSCRLSLVQAASMAVIYSKLGGCLGEAAKLGPLASTDLWAWVKGLLDKLITHFGPGSSKGEEPWGVLSLLGKPLLPGKHQPGKMLPGEHCCLAERQCCPPWGFCLPA